MAINETSTMHLVTPVSVKLSTGAGNNIAGNCCIEKLAPNEPDNIPTNSPRVDLARDNKFP